MFTARDAEEYLKDQNSYESVLESVLSKVKNNIRDLKSNITIFCFDEVNNHYSDRLQKDLINMGYSIDYEEKKCQPVNGFQRTLKMLKISF